MVGEVTERIAVVRPAMFPDELKARVASGLVLGAMALAANWASPTLFAGLVAIVALLLCWEWSGVVRFAPFDAGFVVQAAAVVAAAALMVLGRPAAACAAVAVGAVLVVVACQRQQPLLSGFGALYVGLPVIALIWLRSDGAMGALAILFIYAVVWATDIFAYICGKLIGGPKLWPRVSPGKTWAGTIGGIGFAALAGLVFAWWISHTAPGVLALTAVVLSVAAQLGDLAESALKRAFGVKHASQLIPGHGGFMDRMDGIVAAALVSALLALAVNSQAPARALLYWS